MAAVGQKEGNDAVTLEDITNAQRVIALVQNEFKVFECSSCQKNFGFQLKKDPNVRFCNSECLSAGLQRVYEILKGRNPSNDASPMNSPSPLSVSTKFSNGFPDVGSGKSYHPQGVPNEDGAKARLIKGLQTGGAGGFRNGGFTNGRAPPSFSSDRGRPSSGRQSYQPSENPFYRGSDQVDKGIDFHSSGPSQQQIDAAFTRNSTKQALETGFSTVEQEEREQFLNLAKTPYKSEVKPEGSPKVNNNNPLFDRPKLKPASEPIVVKPKATTAALPPVLKKVEKPLEQDKERATGRSAPPPILKTVGKPSKPEQDEEWALPSKAKPLETKKVAISETKPPVAAAKKIYNMNNVMLSTSLYDLAPCHISFPWSAVKFTVSAAADIEKLESLQSEVNNYARPAPGLTRVPAINDIVFAPYEGDFYRARVVKVDEKAKEVLASFIDYGDAQSVKISECKEPLDSIMEKHPVYGVIFSLTLDVEVPESFKLPASLDSLLEQQVSLKIEERDIDDWKGVLNLSDKRSLNDAVRDLLKPKAAPAPAKVSNGPPVLRTVQPPPQAAKSVPVLKTVQPPPQAAKSVPVLKTVQTPVQKTEPAPVLKPVQPKASTTTTPTPPPAAATPSPTPVKAPFIVKVGTKLNASPASSKPSPPPRRRSKWNIDTIKTSHKIATEAHIVISYIWEMAKINVHAAEDLDNLEYLQLEINKYIPNAPAMTEPPQIGDVVLAPYDGVYYRGRVGGVTEKGIDVIFLDYGDKTTASLADVKEPSDEIMKHPIYGVMLKVEGIPDDIPQMDHDEVNAAVENGGQLELKDLSNICCWTGQIWFDAEKNWETMVSDILKATGK